MYCVLYQWEIASGKRDEFVAAWEIITEHYLAHHGALGSRLHHVKGGTFVAYAQWSSAQHRNHAFAANDGPTEAINLMQACVMRRLEPIEMSIVSDKLKPIADC